MTERRQIKDVVVLAMPPRGACPTCEDGVFEGRRCPRCHGDGLDPFPAAPHCGHADCGCNPEDFHPIGFADDAQTQPVYECGNARYTCVHFAEDVQLAADAAGDADDDAIGWGVLELDGGRKRLGGFISQAMIAGVPCLRVQVPLGQDRSATIIYNASAMYSLTPTSEEVAKVIAAHPEASVSPAPADLERGHAEPILSRPGGDVPIAGEGAAQ